MTNTKQKIEKLFKFFELRDLEVYLVGGTVRDLLMNKEPKDFDFATPHTPDEIKERFAGMINPLTENSSKFGTVFLNLLGETIEITTFRKDITPGRKPKTSFTRDMNVDAMRRDFTINALYMPNVDTVLDPTDDGIDDIQSKVLSTVGCTYDRMKEDPLRILRAIRFICKGFKPNSAMLFFLTAYDLSKMMDEISRERIRDELLKILEIDPRKGLKLLKKYKLLEFILDGISDIYGYNQERPDHHKWGLFNHSILTAEELHRRGADPELILIGFLHDIGKPFSMELKGDYLSHETYGAFLTSTIFRTLKFSNKSIKRAETLVKHHMRLHGGHSGGHSMRNLLKTQHLMIKARINPQDIFDLYYADLWGSRFEKNYSVIPMLPPNPVNGHDCIDLLEEFNSEDYLLIGEMLDKSWEYIYRKPNMTKESILSRLRDFTHSKTVFETKRNAYCYRCEKMCKGSFTRGMFGGIQGSCDDCGHKSERHETDLRTLEKS